MPWIDIESNLFGNDVLVIPVESSEELSIEITGSENAILGQGNGKSEKVLVILHDIAFVPDVGLRGKFDKL